MNRAHVVAAMFVLFSSSVLAEPPLQPEKLTLLGSSVHVVRVNLRSYALRIISTSRLLASRGSVAPTLEVAGLELRRSSGDFILASAGLYRSDPFDPAGLLVADSLALAPLSTNQGRRLELSGILCVSAKGIASVLSIEEYRTQRAACAGAIQAGPVVVLDRAPALAKMPPLDQDLISTRRLVTCIEKESAERFAFFFFQKATISQVKDFLRSRCSAAINLSGSGQAGISIWRHGEMVRDTKIGETASQLPSLIQAAPRK